MDRVYFTEHKRRKFLYIDMSKCSAEEMFAVIANARGIIRNQPEKSVFSLTDVTDAWFDPEVIKARGQVEPTPEPQVEYLFFHHH